MSRLKCGDRVESGLWGRGTLRTDPFPSTAYDPLQIVAEVEFDGDTMIVQIPISELERVDVVTALGEVLD